MSACHIRIPGIANSGQFLRRRPQGGSAPIAAVADVKTILVKAQVMQSCDPEAAQRLVDVILDGLRTR